MCEWTGCPGATLHTLYDSHLVLQPNDIAQPFSTFPSFKLEQVASTSQLHPPEQLHLPEQPHLPTEQREKLLKQLQLPASSRFKFASEDELNKLTKGVISTSTTNSTRWAIKTFQLWCRERNSKEILEPVPFNLLECSDPELLKHFARFIVEVRKTNGENYPPATLHQILSVLLRYMREVSPQCPNFLDKSDARFRKLHRTMDAVFHDLHVDGIGRQVKHAQLITATEENSLWNNGSPRALQNAVFFTVGKMFCLRGGQEHRGLKISQVVRFYDPDRYVYYENVSKNGNGSFKQLHAKNKEVPFFCVRQQGKDAQYGFWINISASCPRELLHKIYFMYEH